MRFMVDFPKFVFLDSSQEQTCIAFHVSNFENMIMKFLHEVLQYVSLEPWKVNSLEILDKEVIDNIPSWHV